MKIYKSAFHATHDEETADKLMNEVDQEIKSMDEIRKLVLAGKSKEVKKLLLTTHQLRILNSISGEITSRELADKTGRSIQAASQGLQWIERKGYLTSREEVDPTGGHYLVYQKTES